MGKGEYKQENKCPASNSLEQHPLMLRVINDFPSQLTDCSLFFQNFEVVWF